METWTPDDLRKHLEAGDTVFLKLWKQGCGACKLSIPATERLEKNPDYPIIFAKISTDEHPEMFDIAETDVLPAFFVFKNKTMAGKLIGFKGLAKLQGFLDEALGRDVNRSEV